METVMETLVMLGLLAVTAVIAGLTERRTAGRQQRRPMFLHVIFPCLLVLLLYIRCPEPVAALRGLALILPLYTAALQDLYSKEVDDCLWVMALLAAFIQFDPAVLPSMLAGAVMTALPLFAAAMLKTGSVGGADIKMMAAVGLYFGVHKGLFALFLGLAIGVAGVFIRRKVKKEPMGGSFPLVPFLAAGSYIACLL